MLRAENQLFILVEQQSLSKLLQKRHRFYVKDVAEGEICFIAKSFRNIQREIPPPPRRVIRVHTPPRGISIRFRIKPSEGPTVRAKYL